MTDESIFAIVFIATLLVTRVFLYFARMSAGYIGPFRLHHYMYGILLVIAAVFFENIPLYAIGWGLIVDQLMIFPTKAKTWSDYFSPLFLIGTAVFAIIFLLLRGQIVSIIQ